jgi:heptosyltransferase II
MMPSLVVQTSFLGDVVLTTPLLSLLAARGPVDVLTTSAGAAVLRGHRAVREVFVYDKRGADRGIAGTLRTAGVLRARGYQVAYFAQGSVRSAAVGLLARIPARVGFETSAGRRLYTDIVVYNPDRHHAERLWMLGATAEERAVGPGLLRPSLFPSPEDVAAVDASLPGPNRDLIVIAPGSRWGTKRWPYFEELVSRLAESHSIAIIGDSADTAIAERMRSHDPERVIDLTGRLSILGSAELIRRAMLLVTNDSAPQHLASAMGTPTITLFGPTVPDFGFGPLAEGSVSLGVEKLACRPCDSHGPERCPLGHWRCMRELSVDSVATLTERMKRLDQTK